MEGKLSIKVILGSTRPGRFGEKVAPWIMDSLKAQEGVEAELLDLRDYPMPFFNEAVSPNYKKEPYTEPNVVKWTAKIAEADGYIMIAPEYNHGYSAVLKNAIDYVGPEWHDKAVAFVSYGSVAGGRVVEQLREVAVELQMAPIRNAVHIPWDVYMKVAGLGGTAEPEALKGLDERAKAMIDQLIWWTKALKVARAGSKA
jgi:NAD(P)H-dependent FMN reductase